MIGQTPGIISKHVDIASRLRKDSVHLVKMGHLAFCEYESRLIFNRMASGKVGAIKNAIKVSRFIL